MILDANCWLGHWWHDHLEPDTAEELVARQAVLGINLSCVASLDAILYHEPMVANRALFWAVHHHPTLEPVAILNPVMANWPDSLETCVAHRGRQIRLLPNYHGYRLDDSRLEALLDRCAELGVRVSIQVRVLDERAQHPCFQVPGLPVSDLAELATRRPDDSFLLLCCYRAEVLRLGEYHNLLFGLSHVEYLDTLDSVLAQVPAEQLVFATHTPLLEARAMLAKLRQSQADAGAKEMVAGGNLACWLGGERDQVPFLETSAW